jgi:hypothetical protein
MGRSIIITVLCGVIANRKSTHDRGALAHVGSDGVRTRNVGGRRMSFGYREGYCNWLGPRGRRAALNDSLGRSRRGAGLHMASSLRESSRRVRSQSGCWSDWLDSRSSWAIRVGIQERVKSVCRRGKFRTGIERERFTFGITDGYVMGACLCLRRRWLTSRVVGMGGRSW